VTVEEIAAYLDCDDLRVGESRKVSAPYRDDPNPSLNVTRKKNTFLFFDHGHEGDTFAALVEHFSSNGRLLEGQATVRRTSRSEPDEVYDYVDEEGRLVFQVVRGPGKQFKQRRRVGKKWVNNLGDVRRVLYRLPEVIAAVEQGDVVYVVEGEKDANAIFEAGAVATCNPMGAGKWRDAYGQQLEGAQVIVVADRDLAGRKHARTVAQSLAGTTSSMRVVEAFTGKDVSDHLDAGHSLDDLPDADYLEVSQVQILEPVPGGDAILDAPAGVESFWGDSHSSLWACGEPFMLVGPQGVGKTTLMQQVILARIGVRDPHVLSFPVRVDERPVLYLAADRPSQARRSFARMVTEDDRDLLNERLMFWKGPPPFDAGREPDAFAEWVVSSGCSTCIIDSLKDIAADLSKDETGSRVNIAFQRIIANEVELGTLHHQRKATAENKKPKSLSDVYGSTWLTSGHGSVVLLWGSPGDLVVELSHLKQPAEIVGPLDVLHDHEVGESRVLADGVDVRVHFKKGEDVTVRQAAQRLSHTDHPTRNEIEQARRKLTRLVREGKARVREGSNAGTAEKIYSILDAKDLDRGSK
jgi:hypothetical protein